MKSAERRMPTLASLLEIPQTTTCEYGCGFSVDSPASTKNLCSICYNDYHLLNESSKLPKIITQKTSKNLLSGGIFKSLVGVLKQFWQSSDDEEDDVKDFCEYVCDNKVASFGRRCHCGGRFCVVHRLPEEHACKHISVRESVVEFFKVKSAPNKENYLNDDDLLSDVGFRKGLM